MKNISKRWFGFLILFWCVSGFAQSPPPFPNQYFPFLDGFQTFYGADPLSLSTNLLSVEVDGGPFFGNLLILDETNLVPAFLNYNVQDTNYGVTHRNLNYSSGTALWYFIPNWSSMSLGGTGPGQKACLISGGDFRSNAPNGLFEIYMDAGGSNIYFGGVGAGTAVTYVSAPISLVSNTFYQFGVEWSADDSEIYINQVLAATGDGVSIVPTHSTWTNGWYLGSDSTGFGQSRGGTHALTTWSEEVGGFYTNGWLSVSNALAAWQASLGGGGFGGMMGMVFGGGGGGSSFSNNLVLVSPWIHDPYTLPDGSFTDFQTLMDTTASNYAVANTNDWQTADLNNAVAWAVANGVPTTMTNASGGVSYLVSTNEGVLYVGDYTLGAAETIETTNVWPGGSLGLNLNGTNTTLFMWDGGKLLLTHVELTPRVSWIGSTTNVVDHSTAVADVLVGAGVSPNDKGMSFAGKLQAGSDTNDVPGMIREAGTNHMRLSNHSYNHATGWNLIGTNWYWFGYSSISTNVDPRYGNYTSYSSNYDTIAWTDPPGVGDAATNLQNPAIKLVHDLDLRVISPNGTTNFPWVLNPDLTNRTAAARSAAATMGDNIRDNVEQVYIAAPTVGTYQVRVTHKGGGFPNYQWVSIVVSPNMTPVVIPFAINTLLQTATNQIAIGWGAMVGQRYKVQYVNALSSTNNWQDIGGGISAVLTNVVELLPYTNTVSQAFYRVIQAK